MDDTPVLVDIVLVGGGHAHVYVLKMFGMQPLPGVRLTLVTKHALTPYSGMIPGHIAGKYTRKECHVDLVRLARFANARCIIAEVNGIDQRTKQISLKGPRPAIHFDILTIDIGSTPTSMYTSVKCVKQLKNNRSENCQENSTNKFTEEPLNQQSITPVKPIDTFSARWDHIYKVVASAPAGATFRLVIVGGGAGGVELAFSMHHRLTTMLQSRASAINDKDTGDLQHRKPTTDKPAVGITLEMTLLTRGRCILASHNKSVQDSASRLLRERGINVLVRHEVVDVITCDGNKKRSVSTGRAVTSNSSNNSKTGSTHVKMLKCANGSTHAFDECVWCTQAQGASWLKDTGLKLDKGGFIMVQDTLESVNSPSIFACGDIASVVNQPRPKSGVYAVRQGKPLFDNLRRAAIGQPLRPFVQQKSGLAIIGCGNDYAIASKDLPDIELMMEVMSRDTNRLKRKTQILNKVAKNHGQDALHVLSHAAMRCGGCGSKVGATVLSRVMRRLRSVGLLSPPDNAAETVLVGLDDPDDAAVVRPAPEGHVSVHTVDFFRSFIDDPYVFGEIAANHALSDCHAMCADPYTALAIVTVPYGLAKEVEETIFQVMAGACSVLHEAGCALVGGHTAEGAELCLGFSVNGIAREESVLHKGGMGFGDCIIITKAVGTGALFAAHMRGLSAGDDVQNALVEMRRSNRQAARILRDIGAATCCTDITGFGVVGHLIEMLQASDPDHISAGQDRHKETYFGAEINLDLLPVLPGAEAALAQGITSSLQSANLTARRGIAGATQDGVTQKALRSHPYYPLLFDPQTAGGLLATVPAERADDVIKALQNIGLSDACLLGQVTSVMDKVERVAVKIESTNSERVAEVIMTSERKKREMQKKRQISGKGKIRQITSIVSAMIWPENHGRGGQSLKSTSNCELRWLPFLLGLLLGVAIACATGVGILPLQGTSQNVCPSVD